MVDVSKLDDCSYTKDLSKEKILEAIKANSVTHLNLNGQLRCVTWPNESIRALFTPAIQSLDLAENMLYDRGGYAIAYALKDCSSLTSLNLSNNRIGEAMARIFGSIAANKLPISHLDCTHNQMVGSEIPSLVELISKSTTLTSLSFSLDSGKVVDEGLFQGLKQNTLLQELNILEPTEVSTFAVEDCFSGNRTIVRGRGAGGISRFITINHFCKAFGATEEQRRSIPLLMESREEIRSFLEKITQKTEPSKLMKLVVLGHAQIGKTTLVKAIHKAKTSWVRQKINKNVLKPHKSTVGIECSSLKLDAGYVSVWDVGAHAESAVPSFFFPHETAIYLLCYDLSKPPEQQQLQLKYWLDFLQSSLPTVSQSPSSNWKVIIVGLKKDICKPQAPQLNETLWPSIPFHSPRFSISSTILSDLKALLSAIEGVCVSIFALRALLVPTCYRKILQSLPVEAVSPVSQIQLPEKYCKSQATLAEAVSYLQAIGQVAFLKNGLICTSRHIVPTITARLCQQLQRVANCNFALLEESEKSKATEELKWLHELGVCYKLADARPMYLFPSFPVTTNEIKFTKESAHTQLAGLRIVALQKQIFIPSFFYQLVVAVLKRLHESFPLKHMMSCRGMFTGELLMTIEPDSRTIIALIKATNPDLSVVREIISSLTHTLFPQYFACKQQTLCPTCIEMYFRKEFSQESIGVVNANRFIYSQVCEPLNHKIERLPNSGTEGSTMCWTHTQVVHDVYLNYKELFEGIKSRFPSSESNGGLLEIVYEKLATSKKKNGDPIFAFWDKKCLNYCQDWEGATLKGLQSSKAILLLISDRVLDCIANTASVRQDNILIEYPKVGFASDLNSSDSLRYELAILQHEIKGTKVIPVYVAEITSEGGFERFNADKALVGLHNTQHIREESVQRLIDAQSKALSLEKRAELKSVKKTVERGVRLDSRGEDSAELKALVDAVMLVESV